MPRRRTIIKKIVLVLTGGSIILALMQVIIFTWIWNTADPIKKVDVIIVFPGEQERIVEGYALAKAGYADNLLIIGQTEESYSKLLRQHGLLPNVRLLASAKSRSTFEDVIIAQKIILENRFDSALLVTSSYHMPRTLLLFKMSLLHSGANVELLTHQVEPQATRHLFRKIHFCYSEMIKLWGSTAEMIVYRLTCTELRDAPFFAEAGEFAKKFLLFPE